MATKTVRVELTGDPSSLDRSLTVVSEKSGAVASKMEGHASRIGGAFGKLDNLLGGFGIPFTGAIGTLGSKFDDLAAHGEGAFKRISAAGGAVLVGIGAAAVGIGIESVHLADQFEKSHANLETAVRNSGGSMEQLNPIIDSQTDKFAKLGFNATQYEGALAAGTLATGNSQKALGLMSHAADLAAFSHTSLEKATIALAKASEGNLRPLKQLGIDLPIQAANAVQVAKAQDKLTAAIDAGRLVEEKVNDGRLKGVAASDALRAAYKKIADAQQNLNDKQNAGSEILDAVNAKTEGASAKAAETFQGKIKALEAELENMGIKIGTFLIPIIEELVGAISDTISWFEKHKAAAIAVAGVISTVLGAAIAVFVYDKVTSFVSGVGRMIDGLGRLIARSAETAAAVEADSAAMAASAETSGAAVGAGGAEAAAGGAAAAEGGGLAAFASSAAAIAIPIALVAGLAYGMGKAFGFVDDESVKVHFSLGNLANESVPQLAGRFSDLTTSAQGMDRALGDNAASTLGAKTMHQEFNQVLEQTPQFAQKYIDAVQQAGGSTSWYSQKLQEHVAAAEEARVAQERMALQMEIVDAKARGDAGAVYGLTLQLNALPTDKQIYIATHGLDAVFGQLNEVALQLQNITAQDYVIRVTAQGDALGLAASGTSDRNVKKNVVPIGW